MLASGSLANVARMAVRDGAAKTAHRNSNTKPNDIFRGVASFRHSSRTLDFPEAKTTQMVKIVYREFIEASVSANVSGGCDLLTI